MADKGHILLFSKQHDSTTAPSERDLCHTVTAWLGLEKQCSLGLHHLLLLQLPLQMYLHGLSYLRYLCS